MGEVVGVVVDAVLIALTEARMAWERRRYRRGRPPGPGNLMLWIVVAALPAVLVLVLIGIWYGLRVVKVDA